MQILQSVKVKNPEHARFDQAGAVFGFPEDTTTVEVRFDTDRAVEVVAVADLVQL